MPETGRKAGPQLTNKASTMGRTSTVKGYYGSWNTPCLIFTCEDESGSGYWHAVEGSVNVNHTYDPMPLGTDVETIADDDSFTAASPILSEEELEAAVEDSEGEGDDADDVGAYLEAIDNLQEEGKVVVEAVIADALKRTSRADHIDRPALREALNNAVDAYDREQVAEAIRRGKIREEDRETVTDYLSEYQVERRDEVFQDSE